MIRLLWLCTISYFYRLWRWLLDKNEEDVTSATAHRVFKFKVSDLLGPNAKYQRTSEGSQYVPAETINTDGFEWRLDIYPKGHVKSSPGYACCGIRSTLRQPVLRNYSIFLISPQGLAYGVAYFAMRVDPERPCSSTRDFIHTSDLQHFAVNGIITFHVSITLYNKQTEYLHNSSAASRKKTNTQQQPGPVPGTHLLRHYPDCARRAHPCAQVFGMSSLSCAAGYVPASHERSRLL